MAISPGPVPSRTSWLISLTMPSISSDSFAYFVSRRSVRPGHDLRRRAVGGLGLDDGAVGIAVAHIDQVPRARAGEAEDRLIVVADDADLLALAEPSVEQRLLQEVDVLILVDGDRLVAGLEAFAAVGIVLVHLDRKLEQVLEVQLARSLLAPLVLGVDALHELHGQRRQVPVEVVDVVHRADAATLRALDLARELAEVLLTVLLR